MSDLWLHDRYDWMTRQSWRSPTGMSFYPAGRMTVAPRIVVNHSTETTDFPGYNGGAAAPHFTAHLITGAVRQHVPLNWGSRCLAVSTGGVTDRTVNITGTIQIEWIGAVTPGYPDQYGHYDIPRRFPTDTRAQGYVARLWRAIPDAPGIPLAMVPGLLWVPYPTSYGVRARQRLSSAAFRNARGHLGHMHAVANDHGDGLLGRAVNGRAVDMEAVLALARGGAPVTPGRDGDVFFEGADGPDVHAWQTDLATLGYSLTGTGPFGPITTAATRAFQADAGITVDGRVGPITLTTMEDAMSKIIEELAALRRDLPRLINEHPYAHPHTGELSQAAAYAAFANTNASRAHRMATQAVTESAALRGAVEGLLEVLSELHGIDTEAVTKAVEDGVAAAISRVEADVRLVLATTDTEPQED